MPVIVFAINRGDILVANSGIWLQGKKYFPNAYTDQEYVGPKTPQNLERARIQFETIADQYGRAMGKTVKYTPIKFKNSDTKKPYGRFSTKFIAPENTTGFIKGTYPDIDYVGETESEAAAREFQEEIGVGFPASSFEKIEVDPSLKGYHVFKLSVSDVDRDNITNSWNKMHENKVGELYNLRWLPIYEVQNTHLNAESEMVKKYIPVSSGGKKRSKKTLKSKRSKRRGTSRR